MLIFTDRISKSKVVTDVGSETQVSRDEKRLEEARWETVFPMNFTCFR